MRFLSVVIISLALALSLACAGGEKKASTPLDTFKAYNEAARKKDLTTMKLLISESSRKMHEQEAKAKGVTLDDVIKTETLIGEDQKTVEHRNQKIEGDKATLEIKNSYGTWETLPFVLEDGMWKIDKQGYAEQMIQDVEQEQKKAFDNLMPNRQP
jgi:hypothetical protein